MNTKNTIEDERSRLIRERDEAVKAANLHREKHALARISYDATERRNHELSICVKRLEEAGGVVANILSSKTPDINCSCHISAPCSDCVDHGGSREALDNWNKAKEAKP